MTDIATSYIQLSSGAVLAVFALVQLVYRNKTVINYILSGILACVGFTVVYLWLFRTGLIGNLRFLIYQDITVTFVIGPLVYFYLRSIIGISPPPMRTVLLNFIPALISLSAVTAINICEPSISAHYIASREYAPDYSLHMIIWWADKISNSCMLAYFVLTVAAILRLISRKSEGSAFELKFILAYLLLVTAATASMIAASLTRNDILMNASVTALALLGIFYIIGGFRYPELTPKAICEARTIRVRAYIAENNADDVIRELETLMRDKKLFADEDLSLQKTAAALGVTPHQLSRAINARTGKNFRNYINSFRIREAAVLLQAKPEMTVLDIAFETGFNSKSTFNEAFLKEMGFSPRNCRAKRQGEAKND